MVSRALLNGWPLAPGRLAANNPPRFHAFNSRSRWASVWQLGFWSNARLWAAFVLALGLQAIAVYVPGAHLVFDTEPLPAATALALLGIRTAGERRAYELSALEGRYRDTAAIIVEQLPANAAFITVWQSGSVRFHADRGGSAR